MAAEPPSERRRSTRLARRRQPETPFPLHEPFSRRRFLGVTASLAGGAIWRRAFANAPTGALHMPPGRARSRVVLARDSYLVDGPDVHVQLLSEMLSRVLATLTDTATGPDAWRTILEPNDIVGLKFNRTGQRTIDTTSEYATAVIRSLIEAGWAPNQIVCIEAPSEVEARFGTTIARPGYDPEPIDFESGKDQFAAVLRQITALIDIPYLKTHNIARMTCCLKNLSHGLVKHPARYHGNGCSPFVADIVNAAPIRKKLRLCLVDALRVMYDGGPDATAESLSDEGVIMASFDPVATDTVGLALLNDIRRRFDQRPIAPSGEEIGYLASAHKSGLGVAVWHGIDLIELPR